MILCQYFDAHFNIVVDTAELSYNMYPRASINLLEWCTAARGPLQRTVQINIRLDARWPQCHLAALVCHRRKHSGPSRVCWARSCIGFECANLARYSGANVECKPVRRRFDVCARLRFEFAQISVYLRRVNVRRLRPEALLCPDWVLTCRQTSRWAGVRSTLRLFTVGEWTFYLPTMRKYLGDNIRDTHHSDASVLTGLPPVGKMGKTACKK